MKRNTHGPYLYNNSITHALFTDEKRMNRMEIPQADLKIRGKSSFPACHGLKRRYAPLPTSQRRVSGLAQKSYRIDAFQMETGGLADTYLVMLR